MMENRTDYTFDWFISQIERYKNIISVVLLGCLIIIGLVVYRFYSHKKFNESAQIALSEVIQEYQQAYANHELWNEVEIAAMMGQDQFSGSTLTPYFKIFQVNALIHQNKRDEARDLLSTIIMNLKESSPLYFSYQTLYARLFLSDPECNQQAQGVELLSRLAHTQHNIIRDQAYYYLIDYYYTKHDLAHAREEFEQFKKEFADQKDKEFGSPWLHQAEMMMQKENR